MEKCPNCNVGTIFKDEYGEYPNQYDFRCTDAECSFNDAANDAAEWRHEQYLEDTWQDDDGERHYY